MLRLCLGKTPAGARFRAFPRLDRVSFYHRQQLAALAEIVKSFAEFVEGVLQGHRNANNKSMNKNASLMAGAAWADITPEGSVFLGGYPRVKRMSTGVHDRLTSSALFLSDGETSLVTIANDVACISKTTAWRARQRIEQATGVPAAHVIVTATHTHSGPLTRDLLSNERDPTVPQADSRYVAHLEDCIVDAALRAAGNTRPAELGLGVADGSCVGTNRHDPQGVSNPEMPVLVVRNRRDHTCLAVMLVGNMHPTVLHENSTLIGGDFPAMARQYLQEKVFGRQCVIAYHTGPCGDQSPRHVTRSNTFEEAERLGGLLGQAVHKAVISIEYRSDIDLDCTTATVDLPPRTMPSEAEAEEQAYRAQDRWERLRRDGAPRGEVRTAECDWFGAEATLTLARAAATGRLDAAIASIMPAEIVGMRIGPWRFVVWPGEVYVDFALQVKDRYPNCYPISLANGELQGYLVTEEAVRQGHYEANNALFASPDSGHRLVGKTLELLASL